MLNLKKSLRRAQLEGHEEEIQHYQMQISETEEDLKMYRQLKTKIKESMGLSDHVRPVSPVPPGAPTKKK